MHSLILDLEKFISSEKQKYDQSRVFDINGFKKLFVIISSLTMKEIKEKNNYDLFLSYLNQKDRNTLRTILLKKEYLADEEFLFMLNDLNWFHDFLKKNLSIQ